jgi:hypothetical protein
MINTKHCFTYANDLSLFNNEMENHINYLIDEVVDTYFYLKFRSFSLKGKLKLKVYTYYFDIFP